jgi:hypothetical protein
MCLAGVGASTTTSSRSRPLQQVTQGQEEPASNIDTFSVIVQAWDGWTCSSEWDDATLGYLHLLCSTEYVLLFVYRT